MGVGEKPINVMKNKHKVSMYYYIQYKTCALWVSYVD